MGREKKPEYPEGWNAAFEQFLKGSLDRMKKGKLDGARCGLALAKEILAEELKRTRDPEGAAKAWERLGDAYIKLANAAKERKDANTAKEALEGSNKAHAIAAALERKGKKEGILISVRLEKSAWSDEEISELAERAKKEQAAELFYQLGRAHRLREEYDQAFGALNKALELSKDDPRILEEMGHAHFQKGEYREALRTYDKVLSKDPEKVIRFRWKKSSLRYWRP